MGTSFFRHGFAARPWGLGLVLLGCWFASACDRAPCAGLHVPTRHPKAPHIVSVNVSQQDVIDPWSLVVELVFSAPNGDVVDGSLDLYVGAAGPVSLPLKPYFGPSGIEPNATGGRLAVPVHLSSNAIQDDSLFRLGVQLVDGSHYYSNCTSVELHFLVDAVGLGPVRARAPQALACRCGGPLPSRSREALLAP